MGLLAFMYFTVLEKKFEQSIGKMMTHIYVVSDEKEMKFWQVAVRNLFFIPIFPFILLWVLDPLLMIINKQNKRLSEIVSKTKVVEDIPY